MEYEIYGAPRRKCAACGVTIAWVKSARTLKLVPVNVGTRRSHFEDCKDPNRFSRRQQVDRPVAAIRQERMF